MSISSKRRPLDWDHSPLVARSQVSSDCSKQIERLCYGSGVKNELESVNDLESIV